MTSHNPMAQEQLDAIRGREAKATAGPWGVDGPAQCGPGDTLTVYPVEDGGTVAYVQPSWDDAEFIAHARTDIPALLAEVERLRADNERLRALTTVDDAMVERATHGIAAHWHDMYTNGSLGRQQALAIAALEAVFGTGKGSVQ